MKSGTSRIGSLPVRVPRAHPPASSPKPASRSMELSGRVSASSAESALCLSEEPALGPAASTRSIYEAEESVSARLATKEWETNVSKKRNALPTGAWSTKSVSATPNIRSGKTSAGCAPPKPRPPSTGPLASAPTISSSSPLRMSVSRSAREIRGGSETGASALRIPSS